jgi:hypothetical protein
MRRWTKRKQRQTPYAERNAMTDEQLIQAVAELWVENGGDAEGIVWNWSKIRDAVAAIKQEGGA